MSNASSAELLVGAFLIMGVPAAWRLISIVKPPILAETAVFILCSLASVTALVFAELGCAQLIYSAIILGNGGLWALVLLVPVSWLLHFALREG